MSFLPQEKKNHLTHICKRHRPTWKSANLIVTGGDAVNERRKKKFSEWLRVNFAVLWAILWNWCILFVLKISVCIKLEWVGYLLSCLWWKQICLDVIVAVQFIWRQISFPLSRRSMLSLWVDVLCVVMRITFCIRHTLNLFWLSFSSCYMNWKLCLSFMAWRSIITIYVY